MLSPFTSNLLQWNLQSNTRCMPWKQEKDPYKIWLSEIILQQTRVEQGLGYYNRFIEAYPTLHHLAAAPETAVFKLWEGLGYYSRCKNLIATARFISHQLQGKFPDTYQGISALKGIGPYTAAAIASFAYNLPYAVVDGNVLRVLSRYFGMATPVDNSEGRKMYNRLADALLDKQQPAVYNQAIMDFGAVICKPRQPLCTFCVHFDECEARKHNWISRLPLKEKQLKKKLRWFYYFVVAYNGCLYIRKRNGKDIWQNLYEFVLKEHDGSFPFADITLMQHELQTVLENTHANVIHLSKEFRQQLTHQTINVRFIRVQLHQPSTALSTYEPVPEAALVHYPFPKIITSYLAQNLTRKA